MNKLRLVITASFAAMTIAGIFAHGSLAEKTDAFQHKTAAHKKLDCSSCHKNPTSNWVGARGYPDVVDFPGHASCINCHRADFFAGNRPAICAGCHVSPGPRGAARFSFPLRSRPRQFSTIFPHNVHQDIIASVPKSDVAVAHFVNARFLRQAIPDDKPEFNNCAICHKTSSLMPKFAPRTPSDEKPLADATVDGFLPKAAFFKDIPGGHATCFACHFQSVKPTGTNCAGCHNLTAAYTPSEIVKRYSFKFDHEQKEHSVRDCMTCHVRISQNADVKTLNDPDVPFMACASCHGDKITEESGKRASSIAEKQPAFQCTYCHTPAVGRYPVPASHENR